MVNAVNRWVGRHIFFQWVDDTLSTYASYQHQVMQRMIDYDTEWWNISKRNLNRWLSKKVQKRATPTIRFFQVLEQQFSCCHCHSKTVFNNIKIIFFFRFCVNHICLKRCSGNILQKFLSARKTLTMQTKTFKLDQSERDLLEIPSWYVAAIKMRQVRMIDIRQQNILWSSLTQWW